mmetsp:Transcript_3128/g.8276  ORF Transcript_3128/g.8276 Transcript_3128/m.8276 type:complete len:345 (-) Transcript_3128:2358-3392(-)
MHHPSPTPSMVPHTGGSTAAPRFLPRKRLPTRGGRVLELHSALGAFCLLFSLFLVCAAFFAWVLLLVCLGLLSFRLSRPLCFRGISHRIIDGHRAGFSGNGPPSRSGGRHIRRLGARRLLLRFRGGQLLCVRRSVPVTVSMACSPFNPCVPLCIFLHASPWCLAPAPAPTSAPASESLLQLILQLLPALGRCAPSVDDAFVLTVMRSLTKHALCYAHVVALTFQSLVAGARLPHQSNQLHVGSCLHFEEDTQQHGLHGLRNWLPVLMDDPICSKGATDGTLGGFPDGHLPLVLSVESRHIPFPPCIQEVLHHAALLTLYLESMVLVTDTKRGIATSALLREING